MSTLQEFVRRRERGAVLLDGLATALDASGLDTGDAARDLRAIAERARNGRFHVLLIGCFSSGKSTLLNALVGAPVLPVKVNPCTAILTELVYGDAPSVEIRQVDGPSRHLDVPTFLTEFQLRTSETSDAGAEAVDRFGHVDRAVLSYPLPLLRDGVVLVDTPGLDDDEVRTERTLLSLPEADAVIFVLNASRFLTDLERRVVRRELLPRGLTNLFFPVTMVDLLASLSDDPERERRELGLRARRALGPLCEVDGIDRFDERFFPVDARGGLHARWDRARATRRDPVDEATWAQTGMPPFLASLERFLVDERGSAQLSHLVATSRRVGRDVARRADLDRATATASVDELRRRQEELAPKFDQLAAIARRVARTVDGFVDRQQIAVWQDLRAFLARAEDDLPDAVAAFDLGNTAGFDLLTQRGRERIEAQLREQLDTWLALRVAGWQAELRPRLEAALDELRRQLAGEARDFDAVVAGIVTDFAGGIALPGGATHVEDKEVGAAERWFSVAMGAVMLSPGAMAAGWSEGYEGALKGAASRLGVRVALLAVGALLGPIGWAGLVVYVVSDAVLLVLTGGSRLRRMREQVAASLKGKLVAQADAAKTDIADRVREGLSPLRDGIVAAAEGESTQLREQLERTIAARQAAVRSAAQRDGAWTAVTEAFAAAEGELAGLLSGTTG